MHADGVGMADLIPDFAGPLRLSNDSRLRAALTVVQTCNYDLGLSARMLLMLGLIEECEGGGYVPLSPIESEAWSVQALTTVWK